MKFNKNNNKLIMIIIYDKIKYKKLLYKFFNKFVKIIYRISNI